MIVHNSEGVDQIISSLMKADDHTLSLFVADTQAEAISGFICYTRKVWDNVLCDVIKICLKWKDERRSGIGNL